MLDPDVDRARQIIELEIMIVTMNRDCRWQVVT